MPRYAYPDDLRSREINFRLTDYGYMCIGIRERDCIAIFFATGISYFRSPPLVCPRGIGSNRERLVLSVNFLERNFTRNERMFTPEDSENNFTQIGMMYNFSQE